MVSRLSSRHILLAVAIVLLVLLGRPVIFLLSTHSRDKKPVSTTTPGYANDASNLNTTKISAIIRVPGNIDSAIAQLAVLIKNTAGTNKKISIAGARHSMGGHTIYPDAIVLDMERMHYITYDSITHTIRTGAGTRWSEIIPFLDRIGKSVAVMQSNNSFSVGGSISVNCHGWQPNTPPIASTVESFRLINSKGELVACSRQQNSDLFSLVLGGYGLFGVIVDVQLRVIDNKMYRMQQYIVQSDGYIKEFDKLVQANAGAGLIYGRISINPANFMQEAMISIYRADETELTRPLKENGFTAFRRTVFRGSVNSAYGKDLRWTIEKAGRYLLNNRLFSRNQLINEGVEVFQNTDTNYTDILQEYFIPKQRVHEFIGILRTILPAYHVDLLNITLRNVKKDEDSFLPYAREEVFGFVMLFNQARTAAAEKEMALLAQVLTSKAISLGGTYYLPYRLHAGKEQLYKAYPSAKSFFRLKKQYDPEELFINRFYEKYK
jgi:FAD/FMN-containing dehydrogenase